MAATADLLHLGLDFSHVTPVPPDPEHTTYLEAGPLSIGVEYRVVGPETMVQMVDADGRTVTRPVQVTDTGASIHVCDGATGHEHLRFDAFDDDPHYHYLSPGRSNLVVMFDRAADGDMVPWALECLRHRLPAMLAKAGAEELGQAVGAGVPDGVIEEVAQLIHDRTDSAVAGTGNGDTSP
jgi:hypothetical protein